LLQKKNIMKQDKRSHKCQNENPVSEQNQRLKTSKLKNKILKLEGVHPGKFEGVNQKNSSSGDE